MADEGNAGFTEHEASGNERRRLNREPIAKYRAKEGYKKEKQILAKLCYNELCKDTKRGG